MAGDGDGGGGWRWMIRHGGGCGGKSEAGGRRDFIFAERGEGGGKRPKGASKKPQLTPLEPFLHHHHGGHLNLIGASETESKRKKGGKGNVCVCGKL